MRKRRDRLSELPQSLIHHILSFLPMRDVVSTTVLSKRWNKLWTTVPCLNFCFDLKSSKLVNGADSVRNFVNRALMLWRGTKILKFKIVIRNVFDLSLAGDFDLWVRFAVEYKVEDLSIELRYDSYILEWEDDPVMEDVYSTPQCLNSCSSIKKLSLAGCNLRIDGSPTWYQLTSFEFDGFWFSESLANQILTGSPRLEVFDLSFMECFENLNIRSTSLKKLKIKKYIYSEEEYPTDISHTLLSICCPNLETLEMWGVLYGKYYLSNFSSLTDAILGYYGPHFYDDTPWLLGEKLCQILPAIQHVENLTFSSVCCVQELVVSLRTNLPSPFPNVKFLKLHFDEIELDDMINLLGIFPSLKMLVIEDETTSGSSPEFNIKKFLEFEINVSNSFLRQLKTIHITSRFSDSSIFQVIALLLKHASMLEKLVVWAEWHKRGPPAFPFKVANVLLNIPRSSLTAMVIINPK
ncbi:hypothetical protein ACS0TY_036391 [Phlomoides rotata]